MISAVVPPLAAINSNAPLRLSVAAAVAFRSDSIIASGLRREAARRRLVIGLEEAGRQLGKDGVGPT